MEFPCFHCDTVTKLDVVFEVVEVVCPNCRTVYGKYDGQFKFKSRYSHTLQHSGLHVGQKGKLHGIEYTITGILTKNVHTSYYWKEYILTDAENNFIYLSESDGHWILLKEIPETFDISQKQKIQTYNGMTMNLYEFTDSKIVDAQGFFDFEIPNGKIFMAEYIAPPFVLSTEKINEKLTTSFGEHISSGVIKKAFAGTPNFSFPSKSGIGLVQPFRIHVRDLALIVCVFSILILISHILIYDSKSEKEVLYAELSFDKFSGKDFISPSFTLNGGSAPLTVSVYSEVNNSWANVQVGLVNETTNEEIYANKDVEYYHGYTGGENWKEGDQSEEFNICGVTAGKYHFAITPQRQPEDTANTSMKVRAIWNEPSMWNVWIPIVIMIGIAIAVYYMNVNFEQKRWESSDFSPFD